MSDFTNNDNLYYGLRFGGKRYILQRFCFGWEGSFGGSKFIESKQTLPSFDLNFMLGIMF